MQILVCVVIGILGLFLVEMLIKNKIVQFVCKGCLSSIGIVLMNCLLTQYAIGLNLFTVLFSTLLGIPGLMTLYLLKMMI